MSRRVIPGPRGPKGDQGPPGPGGTMISSLRLNSGFAPDFNTNGNAGLFEPLIGIDSAAFTLSDDSGRLSLGNDGVLTYTGPNTACTVISSLGFSATIGLGNYFASFAWSKNGELTGVSVNTPAFYDAEAQYMMLLQGTSQNWNMSIQRLMPLATGDTLQIMGGNDGPAEITYTLRAFSAKFLFSDG